MLIYRAVGAGEIPLIAAGGDGEGVGQGEHRGIALLLRVLHRHAPGLASWLCAPGVYVAPQAHQGAVYPVLGENIRQPVGGVALGDAAQVHGAALIQGDAGALQGHVLRPHQGEQSVDLRLLRHPGAVGGDAPKGHKRGNGGVKGPAGSLTESQGGGDQVRRLLGHIGAALGVQDIDFASLPGPGQGPVQAVQLLTAGGQGLRSLVSVGGQGHIGVHGEQAQLFRLRLDAAAGKAQQKRRQHGAAYTLHSSRLPSRARISVASSANSRWPPTGMP